MPVSTAAPSELSRTGTSTYRRYDGHDRWPQSRQGALTTSESDYLAMQARWARDRRRGSAAPFNACEKGVRGDIFYGARRPMPARRPPMHLVIGGACRCAVCRRLRARSACVACPYHALSGPRVVAWMFSCVVRRTCARHVCHKPFPTILVTCVCS